MLAEDKFKNIMEAYEVLSDKDKKAQYDMSLGFFKMRQKDKNGGNGVMSANDNFKKEFTYKYSNGQKTKVYNGYKNQENIANDYRG